LLDRGDPAGRSFALALAGAAETPEMLAALGEFAFGQRGPDGDRIEALRALRRAGLVGDGPQRLWARGKWIEVVDLEFEVHCEPANELDPATSRLATQATEAINRGDGAAAERLWRQIIEGYPDRPSAYNNLAMALQLQGRTAEVVAICEDLKTRFPDYLFGIIHRVRDDISAGRFADARAKLNELLNRKRFHISEFRALCQAQIDLADAEGNPEVVELWQGMWENGARSIRPGEDVPTLRPSRARGMFERLASRLSSIAAGTWPVRAKGSCGAALATGMVDFSLRILAAGGADPANPRLRNVTFFATL
jgi:tetratricopeptide (TPR) repeat protein